MIQNYLTKTGAKGTLVGVVCLLIAGCYLFESPLEHTDAEISSFHDAYNSGDFEAIYSRSSGYLRRTENYISFQNRLSELKSDLGEYLGSESISSSSTHSYSCVMAEVVLYSKFDRGSVEEIFEYVLEEGDYNLYSYALGPYDERPSQNDGIVVLERDC